MTPLLSQMRAKAASKLTKTCIIISICCFVFFLLGIGSGLYSAIVFNKPTPVPDAVKHFQHLYKIEGALENEINSNVVPKVKDIADDTVQIVNEMVSRLVRQGRSVGLGLKTVKNRPKRDILAHSALNKRVPIKHTEEELPVMTNDLKSKQEALEKLREELRQCRGEEWNKAYCERFYYNILELTLEIDNKYRRMVDDLKDSVDKIIVFLDENQNMQAEKKSTGSLIEKQKDAYSKYLDTKNELLTPALPNNAVKTRAIFNHPPAYRNRHGYYTGHQPLEDLTNDKFSKLQSDSFYRNPFSHKGHFMDLKHLDEDIQPPKMVETDISKSDTTSTTTEQPKVSDAIGTLLSTFERLANQNSDGAQLGLIYMFQMKPSRNVGQQTPQTE